MHRPIFMILNTSHPRNLYNCAKWQILTTVFPYAIMKKSATAHLPVTNFLQKKQKINNAFGDNVIKLRNCNPAPVILEQAFGARFFAALENDSPKRAAKDLGGGGASCFLNLMTFLLTFAQHNRKGLFSPFLVYYASLFLYHCSSGASMGPASQHALS